MAKTLKLTDVDYDSGNCRVYVEGKMGEKPVGKFVILDQGKGMEKWGNPRFEVYDHTDDGEPGSPLKQSISWEYVGKTHGDLIKGTSVKGFKPEPSLGM